MIISLIAAASTNRVIGVGNDLPWNLPADMKFFKEKTTGHCILMGRKTWNILGKALPGRTSLVVSGKKQDLPDNTFGFLSISEAVLFAKKNGEKELMVIGGGEIYAHTLPLADRSYLTHVRTKIENGTAFFPPIKSTEWKIVSNQNHPKDEKNSLELEFLVLERIRPISKDNL